MVLPQAMAWVQYWFRVLSLKFCGNSKKNCGDISQQSPAFCMYDLCMFEYENMYLCMFEYENMCHPWGGIMTFSLKVSSTQWAKLMMAIWYCWCLWSLCAFPLLACNACWPFAAKLCNIRFQLLSNDKTHFNWDMSKNALHKSINNTPPHCASLSACAAPPVVPAKPNPRGWVCVQSISPGQCTLHC